MERDDIAWLVGHGAVVEQVIRVGGDVERVVAARRMAQQLMDEHGVGGWTLEVGTGKKLAASIRYPVNRKTRLWTGKPGRLILSGPLMSLWTVEEQRETILHEIAHALCPDDHHGPVWRWYCKRLGIEPKRLWGEDGEARVPEEITRRPDRWEGTCPGGHQHRRVNRPSKTLACTLCSPRPDIRYAITWRRIEP